MQRFCSLLTQWILIFVYVRLGQTTVQQVQIENRVVYQETGFNVAKRGSLESIPWTLLNFENNMSICLFRKRASSMKICKYLKWICTFSLQLLSLIISGSHGSCIQGDLNISSSVLVSFNVSLLAFFNHWNNHFQIQ